MHGDEEKRPVIIIDQIDTLLACEERTKETVTLEVFQSVIHTIAKWAIGVCYDDKLAHVIFVASRELSFEKLQQSMSVILL